MKYAYDESYLEDVQKNLGFFFQFLLCNEKMPPEEVQRLFLSSEIPYQIEIGNPDFLCGKSGFELAILALKDKDLSLSISKAQKMPFFPQSDYWCGFVLAYCQWKNNITFEKILQSYSLKQILDIYPLLHEADITKTEELIFSYIRN